MWHAITGGTGIYNFTCGRLPPGLWAVRGLVDHQVQVSRCMLYRPELLPSARYEDPDVVDKRGSHQIYPRSYQDTNGDR